VGAAACGPGASATSPVNIGATAASPRDVVWEYEVRADEHLDLSVSATFRAAFGGPLVVDADARPFVDFADAKAASAGCAAPPCTLTYRVRLAEMAAARADVDTALAAGGALFAPPSSWLAHPDGATSGRLRFHVSTPPGARFVSGVRPSPSGGADNYEADVTAIDEASFAAFGALRVSTAGAGVVAAAKGVALDDAILARWTQAEVDAIARYVGRAPDDRFVVFVAPGTQDVTRGKTLGDGGASVLVRVGTSITSSNLLDDWVLAHELVHVATPSVDGAHAWFAEGLATYVEPIARARAGLTTSERVWGDLVEGLPQGLPKPGDGGLDGERDVGRVYWGGALVFLLADVAIRDETRGAKSLDDVLRAWAAAGGNAEAHWTVARCLEVGDAATGTRALSTLVARHGGGAPKEDLAALWRRLGVARSGERLTFDDAAPLASIREAITATR
jgi:predicted metalloprotease with PDZ domain